MSRTAIFKILLQVLGVCVVFRTLIYLGLNFLDSSTRHADTKVILQDMHLRLDFWAADIKAESRQYVFETTFRACTQHVEGLVSFLSKDTLQGLRLISKNCVLAGTYSVFFKK